jgi:hypothetical protein
MFYNFQILLVILAVCVALFFLGRQINLWYFKINIIEKHLEEINLKMKETVFHLEKLSGVELNGSAFVDEQNLSKFQPGKPQTENKS